MSQTSPFTKAKAANVLMFDFMSTYKEYKELILFFYQNIEIPAKFFFNFTNFTFIIQKKENPRNSNSHIELKLYQKDSI